MEKKDVISAIEQLMKENGLSQEELIAYWNTPQEAPKKQENECQKYPFGVMYDDGTCSWEPQKEKEIWGIIFYGHVISLKKSKEKLTWNKAIEYCQQIKIGKMKGSAGSKTFWETLQMQEQKIIELNKFIHQLGGDEISGVFWTNKQYDHNWAYFAFFTDRNHKKNGISEYFKSIKIFVRPILSLI